MKKLIVATILVASFATTAVAQEQKDRPGKHKSEMRKAGKKKAIAELNLTEAQQTQLKTLGENKRKELETLRSANLSREEAVQRRKAINDKYSAQMQSLLTAEQKDKMQAMKSKHGKHARAHQHNRASYARGFAAGQMASELNLTDAQKTKIQSLRKDFQAQAQALRSNNNLTPEQKKAEMKKLAEAQKQKTREVFTAEQLQKMEEARAKRKNRIS